MLDWCWVRSSTIWCSMRGVVPLTWFNRSRCLSRNRSDWVCFSFSRSVIGISPPLANVALLLLFVPGVMSVSLRSICSPNLDRTSIPRRTLGSNFGNSRNSVAMVRPAAVMSPVSLSSKDISDPSARIATSPHSPFCQPSSRHWWLVFRSTYERTRIWVY